MHGPTSYRLCDKSDDCNILPVRVFNVPPPDGVPCGMLLRQWAQKTRMMPLSDRQKKFDDMLNHLETVRQTDGQTDGWTCHNNIALCMIAC